MFCIALLDACPTIVSGIEMKQSIEIIQTSLKHIDALAQLQQIIFPSLTPGEWFTADMYRAQITVFPEGQLCALLHTEEGTLVVGETTTFRTNRSFDGDVPYYFEVIGHGYLTTHEPDGEWLYGVDVGVHPAYRRLGIGSRLYDARKELVRRMNLRGELVAGLLPGYELHREQVSAEEYVQQVVAGALVDPTLSMQLRNGFRFRRLLKGYIHDPRSNDTATLIVRENPDYRPMT
jgi:GNAT superfamily N-acetyltransferase